MKKLKYVVMGIAFLLGGCSHNDVYYDEELIYEEYDVEVQEPVVTATAVPAEKTVAEPAKAPVQEVPAPKEEIEVMNPNQPVEKLVYDSAYDRFLDNVEIVARSENYVTYEYKDVRVDELAPLASRYCQEHGNRTAFFRGTFLYKNYARRATFDCRRLQ